MSASQKGLFGSDPNEPPFGGPEDPGGYDNPIGGPAAKDDDAPDFSGRFSCIAESLRNHPMTREVCAMVDENPHLQAAWDKNIAGYTIEGEARLSSVMDYLSREAERIGNTLGTAHVKPQ